mgnify:CR=1 FL=1
MDVRGEEDFWEFFEEGLHLFLGSSRIFECIGETISTSVVVVWLLFVLCRQCGNRVVVLVNVWRDSYRERFWGFRRRSPSFPGFVENF